MSISKTVAQYKDWNQLAEFAEAQQSTIISLSKKLQRLEEERDQLKTLVSSSVPIVSTQTSEMKEMIANDSEFICTMEIGKLKKVSLARELTYEESKRLDTYFKILTQINSTKKNPEREVRDLPSENLLQLVEGNGNPTK